MMVDIDHFKAVNDKHGHVLGDKVLRAVAQIVKSNIKGGDRAARFGGEEFAVLLPKTPLSGAVRLGKYVASLVAQMWIR
jgi:diguanylate cyclase